MNNLPLTSLALLLTFRLAAFGQNTNTKDSSFQNITAQEMHDWSIWGAPATNGSGIQIGVNIFLKDNSRIQKFGVGVYVYNTNDWLGYFAPNGYRLSLSLKNADGKDVKKTTLGEAISKSTGQLSKNEILAHRRKPIIPDLLNGKWPKLYESFNLLDCFKAEKPGTYMLMVGGTVYKLKAGVLNKITLPPVSLQVPITQEDLERYQALKEN